MNNDLLRVVVQGACAPAAAQTIARALADAGANVRMSDYNRGISRSAKMTRGQRTVIAIGSETETSHWPLIGRIAYGTLLLLMLLGAEVRLRFGFRADMLITCAAAAAYWHFAIANRRRNENI